MASRKNRFPEPVLTQRDLLEATMRRGDDFIFQRRSRKFQDAQDGLLKRRH
jgi:hypothetical protein